MYCDLVEENNSLLSGENNSGRVMPSKLLAVVPKGESGVYPELLIPAEKRVINNNYFEKSKTKSLRFLTSMMRR